MTLFGKKKSKVEIDAKEVLCEQIGMDEEELAREDISEQRRKELRMSIASKYDTLAKMKQTKEISGDGWAKIIVGVLAFLAATVPVGMKIHNYNIQYRRDRNADDNVQNDYGRSKHSSSNQVDKP